jgi:hypothetical protein
MGTLSDRFHLIVNLKKKMYLYVSSTTKGVKRKCKSFLIEDFFHLPPVKTTPVVHLELQISPQSFEKF